MSRFDRPQCRERRRRFAKFTRRLMSPGRFAPQRAAIAWIADRMEGLCGSEVDLPPMLIVRPSIPLPPHTILLASGIGIRRMAGLGDPDGIRRLESSRTWEPTSSGSTLCPTVRMYAQAHRHASYPALDGGTTRGRRPVATARYTRRHHRP